VKLASDLVLTTDFSALLQSRQQPDATLEKPSGDTGRALERALPKAGQAGVRSIFFDPNELPALDGELQYAIAKLQAPQLMLRDLNLNASLRDGLPRLALSGRGQHNGKPVVVDLDAGAEGGQAGNPVYTINA
jgi:hypothetical protein